VRRGEKIKVLSKLLIEFRVALFRIVLDKNELNLVPKRNSELAIVCLCLYLRIVVG